MSDTLKRLISGEEGATMMEYAIMLALIGAAMVTAVTSLGTAVGGKFTFATSTLNGAGS